MFKAVIMLLFLVSVEANAFPINLYCQQEQPTVNIAYNKGVALKNESALNITKVLVVNLKNEAVFVKKNLGSKTAYYFPLRLQKGIYVVKVTTPKYQFSKRILVE